MKKVWWRGKCPSCLYNIPCTVKCGWCWWHGLSPCLAMAMPVLIPPSLSYLRFSLVCGGMAVWAGWLALQQAVVPSPACADYTRMWPGCLHLQRFLEQLPHLPQHFHNLLFPSSNTPSLWKNTLCPCHTAALPLTVCLSSRLTVLHYYMCLSLILHTGTTQALLSCLCNMPHYLLQQ